jgi:hypothetical protein
MAQTPERLASEDVIINAPLSYAGSLQRISRGRRLVAQQHAAIRILFDLLVIVPCVLFAWAFTTCWYLFFGLWIVPYRLLRRGSRKRKKEAFQHQEMMKAVNQVQQATLATAINTGVSAGLIETPAVTQPAEIEAHTAQPAISTESTD